MARKVWEVQARQGEGRWQEYLFSSKAREHADQVAVLEQSIADWEALQHRTWTESMGHKVKRKRAAATARRMIAAARAQIDLKTRALEITNATVARLKSSAIPASEIARLEQERNTAQTALAAMVARAERAEQGLETMGERFASLVGRLSKAEASLQERAA